VKHVYVTLIPDFADEELEGIFVYDAMFVFSASNMII